MIAKYSTFDLILIVMELKEIMTTYVGAVDVDWVVVDVEEVAAKHQDNPVILSLAMQMISVLGIPNIVIQRNKEKTSTQKL